MWLPPQNGPLNKPGQAEEDGLDMLVYDPAYDKEGGQEKLQKHINRLFDRLLSRKNSNKGTDLNPFSNYDLYQGKIDLKSEEVRRTTHAAGGPGNAEFIASSFFSTNINRLKGTVLSTGPDFSVETLNPKATIDKLKKISEDLAESFMREMAQEVEDQVGAGVGKAFANPERPVADTDERIYNQLSDKEKIALSITDMMTYCLEVYNGKAELADAFLDECIVGQAWMDVELTHQDPKIIRIDPRDVSWIGPEFPKNSDECDVLGYHRMQPLASMLHKYSPQLAPKGGKDELMKSIREISKGGVGFPHEVNAKTPEDVHKWTEAVYSSYIYHRVGLEQLIGEHIMYFKMLKSIKLRLILDGKPLTPDEFDQYKNGHLERGEEVVYRPVGKGEETQEGESIKEIWVVEPWKAIRLGHRVLVQYGPIPYTYSDPNDPANRKFTMRGFVSKEQSIVSIGSDLAKLHRAIMYTIRKKINMAGSKAVAYDVSQKPKGTTMAGIAYQARETGVYLYDSKQISGDENRVAASRHLSTIDFGISDEIVPLINLAAWTQTTYDMQCGINPSMKGLPENRQGDNVTQEALRQGNLIQFPMFYQHQLLQKDVLTCQANTGKFVWAKADARVLISTTYGKKLFRGSKDMSTEQLGIIIADGYKAQEDKNFMMNLANLRAQGGQGSIKEILTLWNEKNPIKADAILRDGMSAFERSQLELQQQQNQIAAQSAQANAAKAQQPERVAQINADARLQGIKMQIDADLQKNNDNLDAQAYQLEDQGNQALAEQSAAFAHEAGLQANESLTQQ